MDLEEFHSQLADAPVSFHRKLRDYLRNPTERNTYYIAGYIAALEDARLFKTADAASYWLAVIGSAERDSATSNALLAEMDNPPAGSAQAAEIKALREALAVLKAENEMLRKVLKDADNELDWLDEEVDTCDHSVGVCMCSYRDMRRKMKATLFPAGPTHQRGNADIALLVFVVMCAVWLVLIGAMG